jgi:hypothetical protein
MPSRRSRCRAASTSACAPACGLAFSASNSSCAATQSGTNRSAIGWPARTGSNVARTCRRSTNPCTRDCTPVSERSSTATAPVARKPVSSVPDFASTVRTPRLCASRESTATPPSGAASA